jgi:hypothetical protein
VRNRATGNKIEVLYAWVFTDHAGNESLCCAQRGDGWVSLIGASLPHMETLRAEAQRIGELTGLPVSLCRFSRSGTLERLG